MDEITLNHTQLKYLQQLLYTHNKHEVDVVVAIRHSNLDNTVGCNILGNKFLLNEKGQTFNLGQ